MQKTAISLLSKDGFGSAGPGVLRRWCWRQKGPEQARSHSAEQSGCPRQSSGVQRAAAVGRVPQLSQCLQSHL